MPQTQHSPANAILGAVLPARANATAPPSTAHRPHWAAWLAVLLAVALLAILYAGMIDTQILGYIRDDAIYAITAKSLVEGHGYRLIHLPEQPIQVRYPPLYTLLLSAGWWLQPQFPQNLPLLTWLTIAGSLVGFGLTIVYFWRARQIPLWLSIIIPLTGFINYFYAYTATSLMSEGLYYALTALLLVMSWYWLEKDPSRLPSRKQWLALVAASALVCYTRTTGLALVAALGGWLLLQRRWRAALGYLAVTSLVGVLPWAAWVFRHRPPNEQALYTFMLHMPYSDYGHTFEGLFELEFYVKQLVGSLGQFFYNFVEVFMPSLAQGLKLAHFHWHWPLAPWAIRSWVVLQLLLTYGVAGWFLLQVISGIRHCFGQPHRVSVLGLYLTLYVALIILWNFESQMSRFLAVIGPWLWLLVLTPVIAAFRQQRHWLLGPITQRWRRVAVASVLLGALGLMNWLSNGLGLSVLHRARQEHWVADPAHRELWDDYRALFDYVRRYTRPEDRLAAAYEMPLYLYTGRTVLNCYVTNIPIRQAGHDAERAKALTLKTLEHFRIRYVVLEPQQIHHKVEGGDNVVVSGLLKKYPHRFRLVFLSPSSLIGLYELLPPSTAQGPKNSPAPLL
jgi:hypothetical protein